MKYLAWLVVLFLMAAGAAGFVAPDRVVALRWIASTEGGLLGMAVLGSAISIILIMSAPSSRAPKLLQLAGAVMLLAGMATPLFGVERTRAVLDWEAAQGPALFRAGAAVVVALGGCLALLLTPKPAAR